MSGKVLLDTNIIIHLLKGNEQVIPLLNQKEIFVSFVTELELLSYKKITKEEQGIIASLLSDFKIIDINEPIKREAIRLRKKYSLKLPDAIVLASSNFLNIPVISPDKMFLKLEEDVKVILLQL